MKLKFRIEGSEDCWKRTTVWKDGEIVLDEEYMDGRELCPAVVRATGLYEVFDMIHWDSDANWELGYYEWECEATEDDSVYIGRGVTKRLTAEEIADRLLYYVKDCRVNRLDGSLVYYARDWERAKDTLKIMKADIYDMEFWRQSVL